MNENPTSDAPGPDSPGPLDATVPMARPAPVPSASSEDPTLAMAPPARPSSSWEAPGDAIGPYQLIEPLGEGGFGTVWRAEQREPIHREVALKVIKPGMDSREIIARFEAERQALAMMDHPNIAAVLDAGTTANGRPYFVMELVKGTPITEYCDAHQLTIRQRLELFIPVCQAVQHAHQKAILHRDLKPSNILVMEVDGKPVSKVIDFGIAKALGATQEAAFQASLARTVEGMIVGTPQYMSPEQAGSVPDVDTRSDIYTLGVILYELLTGQTPLTREQLKQAAFDEVLRLVRESEAKRPSSRFTPVTEAAKTAATGRHDDPRRLNHAIRGDLDWIVLKALEKDRTRRYETANALALDLRRHLHDEPVSAGPPSAGYRLKKLIRRKKGVFIASTAVLFCLIVGVVATSIALWREQKALNRETAQRELAQSNEKRAMQEAENARRTADFLRSLLSDAAAQVSQGKNGDALIGAMRNATPRLEALADQPEVQYRMVVGAQSIFAQMDMHEEGLSLARKALALAREIYGNDDEKTLQRMAWLALEERLIGDRSVGISLFEECVNRRQALGQRPESNAELLGATWNLAEALGQRGRKQEAQAVWERVLEVYRGREARGESLSLEQRRNYADTLRKVGRFEESLQNVKAGVAQALDESKGKMGRNMSPWLTEQMRLERQLGREDDAVQTCLRLAEWTRRPQDKMTWQDARTLNGCAMFLRDGKHWTAAEELARETVAIAQRSAHLPTLAMVHSDARRLFEAQGRLGEAEAHAKAAVDAARKGDLGVILVKSQGELIPVLDKQKKFEEASSVADQVWQSVTQSKWPGEPDQLRCKEANRIAVLHEHWNEAAPAEEHVKAVRLWRERAAKAIDWNPSAPDSEFNGVPILCQAWWMATLIEEGRMADYKQERPRLLQRVKGTTEPMLAGRAARAALLLPVEGGDHERQVMALAGLAMQKAPDGVGGQPHASRLAMGLALYRGGKFAEALQLLQPALNDTASQTRFGIYAVAAMAHHRLGHQAEAVKLLATAGADDPTFQSKVRRDEVAGRVLFAEAQKLIKP